MWVENSDDTVGNRRVRKSNMKFAMFLLKLNCTSVYAACCCPKYRCPTQTLSETSSVRRAGVETCDILHSVRQRGGGRSGIKMRYWDKNQSHF